MGAMTVRAPRDFERQHNLRVTGRAELETVEALGVQRRGLRKPMTAAGGDLSRLSLVGSVRTVSFTSVCRTRSDIALIR